MKFIAIGLEVEASLPDGSAVAGGSFELPKDHWLYEPSSKEWDKERDVSADTPKPILTPELSEQVTKAVRFAIRGATMNGTEMNFDPDALVLNAVYALCGPFGRTIKK